MIQLQRNKMNNAIARARQIRPRVQWLGDRSFSVTSSDRSSTYQVEFAVNNGQKLAQCNCAAGRSGTLCFHVAAAAAVNIAIQSMRRRTT